MLNINFNSSFDLLFDLIHEINSLILNLNSFGSLLILLHLKLMMLFIFK